MRAVEMAFKANPLALSVPEDTFETWLRDSGYLEVLDQRTSDLHRHTSSITNNPTTTSPTLTPSENGFPAAASAAVNGGLFLSAFSYIGTLLSLFTLNPFSKLVNNDFAGETPSWTLGFFGFCDSYSFPSSPSQARMRVHENVKRYCRNYLTLAAIFFACSLYQMPVALVGLVSSLALWDLFKFFGDRWRLDNYPFTQQCLVRVVQCAAAVIVFVCNVQMALLYTLGVSYAAMIVHASFRKLTPVKQPTRGR